MTLNTGYWDDHGSIKRRLDDKLPRHDKAVGVFIGYDYFEVDQTELSGFVSGLRLWF